MRAKPTFQFPPTAVRLRWCLSVSRKAAKVFALKLSRSALMSGVGWWGEVAGDVYFLWLLISLLSLGYYG